jgi:mannose-6-phosphate isomerase-like protein (cupin superfamily)
MSTLIVKNIFNEVGTGKVDGDVGISISHLAGTESFSMYCTQIKAGKTVGAHYHNQGVEFYQVLSGEGIMHTGTADGSLVKNWDEHVKVKTGDFFMVNEKQIHQLENTGSEDLVLVFSCSNKHITSDRVIVDGFAS